MSICWNSDSGEEEDHLPGRAMHIIIWLLLVHIKMVFTNFLRIVSGVTIHNTPPIPAIMNFPEELMNRMVILQSQFHQTPSRMNLRFTIYGLRFQKLKSTILLVKKFTILISQIPNLKSQLMSAILKREFTL